MILNVIKYTSRVAHMACAAIVSGLAIANYFFGKVVEQAVMGGEDEPLFKMLYGIAGSVVIFSGLANIHLVPKKRKGSEYGPWMSIIYTKFFLSLVLTPLFGKLFAPILFDDVTYREQYEVPIKFWAVVAIFLISTIAKMVREKRNDEFIESEIEENIKKILTSDVFQSWAKQD
jgi:hypothetical protein